MGSRLLPLSLALGALARRRRRPPSHRLLRSSSSRSRCGRGCGLRRRRRRPRREARRGCGRSDARGARPAPARLRRARHGGRRRRRAGARALGRDRRARSSTRCRRSSGCSQPSRAAAARSPRVSCVRAASSSRRRGSPGSAGAASSAWKHCWHSSPIAPSRGRSGGCAAGCEIGASSTSLRNRSVATLIAGLPPSLSFAGSLSARLKRRDVGVDLRERTPGSCTPSPSRRPWRPSGRRCRLRAARATAGGERQRDEERRETRAARSTTPP